MSKTSINRRLASVESNTALKDSRGFLLYYGRVDEHELGSDFVASFVLRDPRKPSVLVSPKDLSPLPFQKKNDYLSPMGVSKSQVPFIPRERLEAYYAEGGGNYSYLTED